MELTAVLEVLSGGALGSIITWIAGRKLRKAEEKKNTASAVSEEDSIYKEMYEREKKFLMSVYNDNLNLRKKVYELQKRITDLEAIFSRMATCVYYDMCPIRDELLRIQNRRDDSDGKKGQRENGDNPDDQGTRAAIGDDTEDSADDNRGSSGDLPGGSGEVAGGNERPGVGKRNDKRRHGRVSRPL